MNPQELRSRLAEAAVLPTLTVHDVDVTLRTVEALVAGGVLAVEILLRTSAAPHAIMAIRARFPDILVGAGTILSPALFDAAVSAGADLVITPGLPAALIEHHRKHAVPMIPGALTPTEVINATNADYRILKYYPAVASNGSIVLGDYANLFPNVSFMPTGNIGFDTLSAFAGLRNVICVGGSWMHAGSLDSIPDNVARSLDMVRSARSG